MDLTGLLFINEKDAYSEFGVFLSEVKETDNVNFAELLKMPTVKSHTAVDYPDEDGERLPSELDVWYEARSLTLQMTLAATNATTFIASYYKLLDEFRRGIITLRVPELSKTFEVYYLSCSKCTPLTPFRNTQLVASTFKLSFREPQPFKNDVE